MSSGTRCGFAGEAWKSVSWDWRLPSFRSCYNHLSSPPNQHADTFTSSCAVCLHYSCFFNRQERCLTDVHGPLREHVVVVGAFLWKRYTFSSLDSLLNRAIEEL